MVATIIPIVILFFSLWLSGFEISIVTILVSFNLSLIASVMFIEGFFKPIFLYFIVWFLPLFSYIESDIAEGRSLRYYAWASIRMKNSLLIEAVFINTIWTILFLISYFYSNKIKVGNKNMNAFKIKNKKVLPWVLLGIVFFAYFVLLNKIGGIEVIARILGGYRRQILGGYYYIVLFLDLGIISAVIFLENKRKKMSLIVIAIIFILKATLGGRAGAFLGL